MIGHAAEKKKNVIKELEEKILKTKRDKEETRKIKEILK